MRRRKKSGAGAVTMRPSGCAGHPCGYKGRSHESGSSHDRRVVPRKRSSAVRDPPMAVVDRRGTDDPEERTVSTTDHPRRRRSSRRRGPRRRPRLVPDRGSGRGASAHPPGRGIARPARCPPERGGGAGTAAGGARHRRPRPFVRATRAARRPRVRGRWRRPAEPRRSCCCPSSPWSPPDRRRSCRRGPTPCSAPRTWSWSPAASRRGTRPAWPGWPSW